MKKKFKLLSIVLSLVMVLFSSATVFAAQPSSELQPMDTNASGVVFSKVIYDNASFSFHTSNYGNAFYARKGNILVIAKSTAPAGYGNAPLAIDLCKSNRETVVMGVYHKGTDSWNQTYEVPADGYYCFHYFNGISYGDSYNFQQKITISAVNYYN